MKDKELLEKNEGNAKDKSKNSLTKDETNVQQNKESGEFKDDYKCAESEIKITTQYVDITWDPLLSSKESTAYLTKNSEFSLTFNEFALLGDTNASYQTNEFNYDQHEYL